MVVSGESRRIAGSIHARSNAKVLRHVKTAESRHFLRSDVEKDEHTVTPLG
jgi:hypothetical protein